MRMSAEPVIPGDGLLVIGYGNTLRSDDGAGVLVAEAVSAWGRPGVRALAVHQLTPELAECLAGTGRAIFVDARLATEDTELAMTRLQAATSFHHAGHVGDPSSLLAVAQGVYGRCAEAWLLTVPGVDFSVGERISATAARGIELALERIAEMAGSFRPRMDPGPAGRGDCAPGIDDSVRRTAPGL